MLDFRIWGKKKGEGVPERGVAEEKRETHFTIFFSDSRYDFNPLCASRYELFFSVSHCSWFMTLEDYMHFSVMERFK